MLIFMSYFSMVATYYTDRFICSMLSQGQGGLHAVINIIPHKYVRSLLT